MPGNNEETYPRLPDNVVVENAEAFTPTDLLKAGAALMQTKAQYTTAVQVLKPRDVEKVIKAIETEAMLAGEDFYYSYPQGGKYVEGPSIGGVQICARNWGNCILSSRLQVVGEVIIAFGDFADFETGYNLTRVYLGKRKILLGKNGKPIYDRDRNDEIVAQIIISKATRNVGDNALPNYVIDAGMRKAKEGVSRRLVEYIAKEGIEKARDLIVSRAARLNVNQDKVEAHFGGRQSWDGPKMLRISGVLKGIEDGYQSVADAFPKEKIEDGEPKEQNKEPLKGDSSGDAPRQAEKKSESGRKPKSEKATAPPANESQQQPASDTTSFGQKEGQHDSTDYHSVSSVIARVERIGSIPEMKNWKQKHYAELNMFPPEDLTDISKAIAKRQLELPEART